MITAVDTNVLLDILAGDLDHSERSLKAFQKCLMEGGLVCCCIVVAELRPFFSSSSEVLNVLEQMSISYSEVSLDTSLEAGAIWGHYRKTKQARDRVIADFVIGAHALTNADRLLSRDRGFYRSYFKGLKVLEP